MVNNFCPPILDTIRANQRLEQISTALKKIKNENLSLCERLEYFGHKTVILEYVSDDDISLCKTLIGNIDKKTNYIIVDHNGLKVIPQNNPDYFISPRKTYFFKKSNEF